jgi:hypothetical protein
VTFTVNTLTDAAATNPNTSAAINVNGDISLRSAIQRGNAMGNASTVYINFAPGLNGDIVLDTLGALPDLQQNFLINGRGATVTVERTANAQANFRIFNVPANSESCIENLYISGGNVGQNADGGGIYNAGWLLLGNVWVGVCDARDGGGIYNSGSLILGTVWEFGNGASRNGGGLYNTGWAVTEASTTITGNSANLRGGGISNASGASLVFLDNTTNVGYNKALAGGGILNAGSFTMSGGIIQWNTTLPDETGTSTGGGIYSNGTLTLTNLIIINNSSKAGGGVYEYQGTLTLDSCTVRGNTAELANGGDGGSWWPGDSIRVLGTTRFFDNLMVDPRS